MKNTNENKTWTLNHRFGEITFEFSKSVDIHKAFDAMKAANTESETWLDSLCDGEDGSNTIGWGLDAGVYPDAVPAFCKAVAETFSDNTFHGGADFTDTRCYWIDQFDFSYDGETLQITESFESDDHGYFCPECGCWIAPAHASFDDDEEIECDDCEENIKASDLKYVPAEVVHQEIKIR